MSAVREIRPLRSMRGHRGDPAVYSIYDMAKKRTGRSKKARVVVMRKLVRMLYFMLKTGQNWKWQDPELTRAKISRLDSKMGGAS